MTEYTRFQNAIISALELYPQTCKGLFMTISDFDYYASFEDDQGYQLLSSEQARQLIELNEAEELEKLISVLRDLELEWHDTLLVDYQEHCLANTETDRNYHGMNGVSNWV